MDTLLDELIDKWCEVKSTAEDWTEVNLSSEMIEDLREIKTWLAKR